MRAKASFVAAGLLLAWSPASSISASRHGASHSTGPNYDSQVTPALLQLFSVGRANFARQAADRFAASLPTPPAGQTFRAELQPIDNQSGGRAYRPPADWDYADGALSLSLDLNTYGGQSGVILRALQTPGRSYEASNAFGARRTVDVDYVVTDSLAVHAQPEPSGRYELKLPVGGPEARRLARDVRAVIEGGTLPGAEGKSVLCHDDTLSPEIDFLQEVHTRDCVVSADVSRVAFVDSSTGKTLREWRNELTVSAAPTLTVEVKSAAVMTAGPTSEQMTAYYPEQALREDRAGHTVMACTVLVSGALSACSVAAEDPAGLGFGAAALQTAHLFKFTPAQAHGKPMESTVTIPLTWTTGG